MQSLAYLARQPILDRSGKIYAYELLFRDSPESDTAIIANDNLATAQVLENVLTNIGLTQLIGENKAFVNCNREMLLDNVIKLLNPKWFVLEILEDVEVDQALINAATHYKEAGFELALDDFIFNQEFLTRFEPLFPLVSYVKMDLVDNDAQSMQKAAEFFKAKGIKLLAEKVEDYATYKTCFNLGYDYFQGFYFARPELVTGKKVDPTSEAILKLLFLLRTHASLEEISQNLEQHPDIAENFLKFINSKAGYVSKTMESVREAIAWVGLRHMQEWLTLILYARPEFGIAPQSSPLFQNATHRARFMELLARFVGGTDDDLPAKAYMVGLISRMDALVGAPLENILVGSPIEGDIREALLQRTGLLGNLLSLADSVEQDDKQTIARHLKDLKISSTLLNRCVYDAYSWSHER